MNIDEAIEILRARGFNVGDAWPDTTGKLRVPVVAANGLEANIEAGRDLCALASGRISLKQLIEREKGA